MGIWRKLERALYASHHGAGAGADAGPRVPTTDYGTMGNIADKGATDATLNDDTMRGLVAYYRREADEPKTLPKCFNNDSDASLVIPQKDTKAALKKIPPYFTIQYLMQTKTANLEAIIKAYKIVDLKKEYSMISILSKQAEDEVVDFDDLLRFIRTNHCLPTIVKSQRLADGLVQMGFKP